MADCHNMCARYRTCQREKKRAYSKNRYHTVTKYDPDKVLQLRDTAKRFRDSNPEYYKSEDLRAYNKAYRTAHPDRHLRANFGITGERYDEMLAEQNGVCAICEEAATGEHVTRGYKLSVDHCHETGEIRGILCGKCNRALGLMNDNPERLIAAANYLQAGGHRSRKVRKVA